jgi:hypothetical protein
MKAAYKDTNSTVSKAVRECKNQAGLMDSSRTPAHQYGTLYMVRSIMLIDMPANKLIKTEVARVVKTDLPKSI